LQSVKTTSGITTVFFDMGSTLARLKPSVYAIYHQVFQKAGHDLPLDEVESAVSASWEIVFAEEATSEYLATLEFSRSWQREVEERVMERLQIRPDVREDIFWNIIAAFENPNSYELYPEVHDVLTTLKNAGYRLAIISNWSWHLPELCDALGITSYFEQIFTSARLGYAKPNPKLFQHVIREMNISPAEAVHTGDSFTADVIGATAHGIGTFWLVRPEENPHAADRPDAPYQPLARIPNLYGVLDYLNLESKK
jgi:putative hydrolase of the HAD superfamily